MANVVLEFMEQRAVIEVAQVFVIELPIAVDVLALIADHFHRTTPKPGDVMRVVRAEIVDQRLNLVAFETREQNAVVVLDPERPQSVVALVEIIRHAALAVHAALKRHADQIAVQVVAPAMVNAGVVRGITV